MNSLWRTILPLLAVAVIGLPLFSAETTSLATTYVQTGLAQAKADAAVSSLAQDLKEETDPLRQKMENAHRKAIGIYDVLRNNEEKRGESKSQSLIETIQRTKDQTESDFRTACAARNALDTQWRQASDLGNQLRQAFNHLSNVDRAFKEARLDITQLVPLYAEIEAKAVEASAQAKAVPIAYTSMCETWEGVATEADRLRKSSSEVMTPTH